MWYPVGHANACLCPSLDGYRTRHPHRRTPFVRCLHPASLPDPVGQCQRPDAHGDRPPPRLHGTLRPQRHSRLCHPRARLPEGEVLPPAQRPARVGRLLRGPVASFAAPKPACLWQTPQHLDAAPGGPGLSRPRLDAPPVESGDDPPGHPTSGRLLAARQALDHQPRPRLRAKKKRATD